MSGNGWFKPWISVQNAVLLIALCYVIALFDLSKSELAGWVQAIGAIVSIWAAWSIANEQGKRAEAVARRQDAAKCAAVFGVLNYAIAVIGCGEIVDNEKIYIEQVRLDVRRVLEMLGRIDLLSLPDPVVISAVCTARRAVELFDKKLFEYIGQYSFANHYKFGIANECVREIQYQAYLCNEAAFKVGG